MVGTVGYILKGQIRMGQIKFALVLVAAVVAGDMFNIAGKLRSVFPFLPGGVN